MRIYNKGTGDKITGPDFREQRDALCLTVKELTLKSGVNHETVRQVETGERPIEQCTFGTLDRLCFALDMKLVVEFGVENVESQNLESENDNLHLSKLRG